VNRKAGERSIFGMQGSGSLAILNLLVNHFYTKISDEEITSAAESLSVEDLAKRDLHANEVATTLEELGQFHDKIKAYLSEDMPKYAIELKEHGLNKKNFTNYFYLSLAHMVKTTPEYINKMKDVKALKLKFKMVKKVLTV
jgi:hypothetical protein